MKYRLLIEYDGTEFSGWQRQSGVATIQEALEDALSVALRRPTAVVGSGRTDAGVHARGQVGHFETAEPIDPFRLRASLNGLLPHAIAVRDVAPAPDSFHARYDAVERLYHYRVSTTPIALERRFRALVVPSPDVDRMNAACHALLGEHDYDSFCLTASETQNRVCTVRDAVWRPEQRAGDWLFCIAADRFLHGMVRAIVGTLVEIGQSKRPADDIGRVLKARDRREAGPAAPAHGLTLEAVRYLDEPRTSPID
ncbi:MAG: tRNA pseudouridine(38-40) synthase TruA [Rhodothermales bacterium]|nr:tRNA pseudouridine(38-40) synthase TruA [Rhodothermales bacterium]